MDDKIHMIDEPLFNPDGSVNTNAIVKLEDAITETIPRRINDQEWNEKCWTFKKEITGAFAGNAVRASPYSCPDDLEKIINYLDACFTLDVFSKLTMDMVEISLNEIEAFLHKYLDDLPQFVQWNERKNKREGHGFTSAHSPKLKPDDDFIDLDALIRNVCIQIRTQRREEKLFNEKFEREQKQEQKERDQQKL